MVKTHLLDYFEETAIKNESKIAVKHNENKISFVDLKNKSKKLATHLLSCVGDSINKPIAVFLPKEINTVIADLAIMYSSNPFMNLDIKTPRERIMNIVELVKPVLIITNKKYSSMLQNIKLPVVLIDEVDWDTMATDTVRLLSRKRSLIDTDPFCLINTSGSTGTPKAVVLNHRSFIDFILVSNERFNFNGNEIMGSLSPVIFDIYDFELCMLMVKGSQIILLDAMLAAFQEFTDKKVVNRGKKPSVLAKLQKIKELLASISPAKEKRRERER